MMHYRSLLVAVLWVVSGYGSIGCVRGFQASNGSSNNPSLLRTKNPVHVRNSSGFRSHTPGTCGNDSVQIDCKKMPIDDTFFVPSSSAAAASSALASPALKATLVRTAAIIHRYKMEVPSRKRSTSSKVPPSSVVTLGCVLAANSGFLNGLGLSGILGRASGVASVTGIYTNAAVVFSASLQPLALLAVLAIPLCYMLGSVLNGLLNPDDSPLDMANLSLVQSSPLMLAGILVLMVNNTGKQSIHSSPTFCLLTFCMGLQNSFTTNMVQGNLLRTSHFSGITSDFGTALGQLLRGNTTNAYKLAIFAKLATSFWAGGMCSVLGVHRWGMTASTGCRLSALLYFWLWTAWTAPMIRQVLDLNLLHLT